MVAAELTLWASLFAIVYTYALYPCVLFVAYAVSQARTDFRYLVSRGDRRRRALPREDLPGVTLVIPVFNEACHLAAKVQNVRELDYPRDRLQIIFVSDGSTDRSDDLLLKVDDANVDVFCLAEHRGKANALNVGVRHARHGIIIFSDAATLFMTDAVRQLVRHFADPAVGVVCGALKFRGGRDFQYTEGTYWRYESMLRLMEARLGATLTASGAIYALRRACYRPLHADDLIDDFVIPMNARRLGFKVLYDPEAEAVDFAGQGVEDEFGRRVRLAVGSFRALKEFCTIRLTPLTLLAFVSHKVMRWVLPFFFIAALVSNVVVAGHTSYGLPLLGAQVVFYLWAAGGLVLGNRLRRVRYGLFAYFLVAMHMAFLLGFLRTVAGRSEVTWRGGQ
jgi:cellulose synthase/poly-beta-1,6-N-acetylglucosamine synthase-like glycosyltransferase